MSFTAKFKPSVLILIAAIGFSFMPIYSLAEENDSPELTFDYMYEYLKPFGKWYKTDEHGFVWQPYKTINNWQPYTVGKWELSEYGWLWVSDFEWGWLTFHYGNWFRHNYLGWCWAPDYEWSPAWVSWYWSDDYVGWAPIPPVSKGEKYEIAPVDWFFVRLADFLSPYFFNNRILYSIVSPEVCVPYVVECNYYFYDCCFYYYDEPCKKRWVGPPCLIVEKNVKRKLKKKKVVTVKKRKSHKNKNKNVIEIFKPVAKRKLKNVNNAKSKKAEITKAKFNNSKKQEQKKIIHTLSEHNLPITPIKPEQTSKRKSAAPSTQNIKKAKRGVPQTVPKTIPRNVPPATKSIPKNVQPAPKTAPRQSQPSAPDNNLLLLQQQKSQLQKSPTPVGK